MDEKAKDVVRLSREIVRSIWDRSRRGEPLLKEEAHIAEILRQHSEYERAWKGDDLDGERREETELPKPFLHVHMHLIAENQLREGNPPEVRTVFKKLEKRGMSRHDIIHLIGRVILREIYVIAKSGRPFDHARYVREILKLTER